MDLTPVDRASLLVAALRMLGGPGSGNFGHAGRPGEVGGSSTEGGTRESTPATFDQMVKVSRRAESVAEDMGVSPSLISVVDKEPRTFTVGNRQFKEAAHYNPTKNEIELNVRMVYDDRMSVTNGIMSHEASHAIYQAARDVQTQEHTEIQNLPKAEYARLYRASGYAREETQAEIHERWPVSAMFHKHTGDSYMETEKEASGERYRKNMEKLQKDDGVSDYSKAYWEPDAVNRMSGQERAIDETLAETSRHHTVGAAWEGNAPHASWLSFSSDLRGLTKLPAMKARLSGKRG